MKKLNEFIGITKSTEDIIVDNAIIVMREFGLNYNEMMDMPFPTYMSIINYLKKASKEKSK